MQKNNINKNKIFKLINNYLYKVLTIDEFKTIFIKLKGVKEQIYNEISKNYLELSADACGVICYRLSSFCFRENFLSQSRVLDEINLKENGIYISSSCQIENDLILVNAKNTYIFNAIIGKNLKIVGKVYIYSETNTFIEIKNNCVLMSGCVVKGEITIGDNVTILNNCIVMDSIEDNMTISLINQLQIKAKTIENYLPSQNLIIYGVFPKFKNTLIIVGDAIYNPKVIIKLKNELKVDYSISYWDKNKIIIKFKNTNAFTLQETENAKIIILSNKNKVLITSSLGLQKALISLNK